MFYSPQSVWAQSKDNYFVDEDRKKENVWSLGLGGQHFFYRLKDERLDGAAAVFEVGFGKVQNRLKYHGSFDIILGPYTKLFSERVPTDFFGTGFKGRIAYALLPYRGGPWGLDVGIGLSYIDMVGRSVGTSSRDGETIESLTMKIASFSSLAGIGFHSFEDARTLGNDPNNLLTRIEGYSVQLDFCYPIKATYKTRLALSESNQANSGDVIGYSILVSGAIYLGF